LTLVEAKRQRRNAEGAAKRALKTNVTVLDPRPEAAVSTIESGRDGRFAYAWASLDVGNG
jgi:hypothetical protein